MRDVVYSLTTSLDGFVTDPKGSIDWGSPDEEVFRLATDEVRGLGFHLMGRRLYEAMRYWEDEEVAASFGPLELEFAAIWRDLPKVVFSRTLTSVEGNARLATGGLAEEIGRLRAVPGEGDIAVGGATLAKQVATLGLIDEYRVRVAPVLLGGGDPYFARDERRVAVELVESRRVGPTVLYLRHRVVRP